jgi:hypothetical protein
MVGAQPARLAKEHRLVRVDAVVRSGAWGQRKLEGYSPALPRQRTHLPPWSTVQTGVSRWIVLNPPTYAGFQWIFSIRPSAAIGVTTS